MPDLRTPDAFLVPPAKIDSVSKGKLYAELCKAAGGSLYFGLDAFTGKKFGRLDPNQSRLYPMGHPFAKEDRYEWHIADNVGDNWVALIPATGDESEADEILFGFLKPDPAADDLDAMDAMRAALESRKFEARKTIDKHNQKIVESLADAS